MAAYQVPHTPCRAFRNSEQGHHLVVCFFLLAIVDVVASLGAAGPQRVRSTSANQKDDDGTTLFILLGGGAAFSV